MVEFADFNHKPMETPMTETTLPLIELLPKQDDGDFLRSVAEAVQWSAPWKMVLPKVGF